MHPVTKMKTKCCTKLMKLQATLMDEVESNMISMHSNEPENLGELVKRLNSMIEENEE